MKASKRIFALVLALVMVFSTCITSFADPVPADGSITIKNATIDETYAAYKIFDATIDATDNTKIAYQISDQSPWYSVVSAATEVFTLNKIPNLTETDDSTTPATEHYTYNVVLNEGKEGDVISLFNNHFTYTTAAGTTPASWTCDVTGASPEASVKATAATETITNLPYGYYFVTSTLGSTVSVDSVNKAPEIVDKNQNPSWDNENPGDPVDPNPGKVIVEGTEKLTKSDADFGDDVYFDIGVNATNYAGGDNQVTYYLISDKLAPGFTLTDPSDLKVTVTPKNGTEKVLTSGTEYTVLGPITDSDGNTLFEVNIPWATVAKDTEGKVATITSLYHANCEIHVTYSAVLNDTAVIAGEGNSNIANFTYLTDKVGEDPETPPTEPQDPEGPDDPDDPDDPNPFEIENKKETKTYTYAVGITKIDGKTKTPLKDAKFSLNTRTGDAEPYTYTKIAAVAIEGEAGYYKLPDGAPAAPTTTTTFVTNDDGVIVIEGLDSGTYYFIEEEAPKGYNILTEPQDVVTELSAEASYIKSYTTYYDKDGNIVAEEAEDGKTLTRTYEVNTKDVVIENNSGAELPATGGNGTGMFYLFGAILLAGGAVLLSTKKRIGAN